ncbi:MAG TPA: copper resistance protein CopC [Actinomycetota bacterium]|nr:copper resistance protein CopC [Actinomycetota bacterium]
MRHLRYLLVALAVGALSAGSLPSAAAQAAPSYQSSDPAKDEMMDHPPTSVTVTFDQPLDQSSWMNVLDECGKEIDAGAATVDLNEMTVDIGKSPSGTYEVVYKAVGVAGVTGESASSFEFMVHHGKPCGAKKKDHHHDPDKKKPDHHDHGDDDDGPGHDDHEDMDMGSGSGSSDHSDHPGMSGSSGSSGHSDHSTASTGHEGAGHGGRHGNHDPGKPGGQATGATDPPVLATGDGAVPIGADGQAVLVGLGLALAEGVLGGWLLRVSGNLA